MNPIKENAHQVLRAIVEDGKEQYSNKELNTLCNLQPQELSDAVEYLNDLEAIESNSEGGMAPYNFSFLFVKSKARFYYHEINSDSKTKIETDKIPSKFENKTDWLISKLKNNRILSVVIVIGIILIALGQITDSFEKISNFLSNKQNNTSLKDDLAKDELIKSRIYDSLQVEIAKKQENLLKVQTDFLYTPNLKVEFGNIFSPEYKIIFINDGKIDIKDIRIYMHLGLYFHYGNTFKLKRISFNNWEQIDILKPGNQKELFLDTANIMNDLNNLEVTKNIDKEGGFLDSAWNYLVEPYEYFVIKYKSRPDLKEYTVRKYLQIMLDSRSKKLMIQDLDFAPFNTEKIRAIKSNKLDD